MATGSSIFYLFSSAESRPLEERQQGSSFVGGHLAGKIRQGQVRSRRKGRGGGDRDRIRRKVRLHQHGTGLGTERSSKSGDHCSGLRRPWTDDHLSVTSGCSHILFFFYFFIFKYFRLVLTY